MSGATPQLSFRFEWEEASAVRAPDLAATWARLEVCVGDETITQVEERATGSSRRSIYCALLPLAEWMVFNWWFLLGHRRPSGSSTGLRRWAESSRTTSWYGWHNVRAAGEGMIWPNLTIIPKGVLTWIAWVADEPSGNRVRFMKTGDAWVPTEQVEMAMTAFVNAVVARLEEQGIRDSVLASEWRELRHTPREEREFCLASAALGLDPYRVEPEAADAIVAVATALSPTEASDMFDAVRVEHLTEVLDWIAASDRQIRGRSPEGRVDLRAIGQAAEVQSVHRGLPWHLGWEQARRVRQTLGVPVTDVLDVSGYFATAERRSPDVRIAALGGWADDTAALVVGQTLAPSAERFAKARAAWHVMNDDDPTRFLITGATAERQRIERAFAAELLAPAAGIAELLGDETDTVTDEELDGVATHFDVSSRLIEHQIDNQLAGLFT